MPRWRHCGRAAPSWTRNPGRRTTASGSGSRPRPGRHPRPFRLPGPWFRFGPVGGLPVGRQPRLLPVDDARRSRAARAHAARTSARLPPRGCRMSVNAVDWAIRFAPVDARHNGAARVLMCLANVADDEAQRASDAQEAGRVVQVQREHGQTPPVMAGAKRADPSRRPTPRPGISASGTGPSCGICAWGTVWSSTPTSSTRTTSTRPEEDGPQRKAPAHT